MTNAQWPMHNGTSSRCAFLFDLEFAEHEDGLRVELRVEQENGRSCIGFVHQ
jgi:hypothetical protein